MRQATATCHMNWMRLVLGLQIALMAALCALLPVSAKAHSLDASFAGIYIGDDGRSFSMRITMNMEALMAGVDLKLADTNDSPNAPEYNRLRALPPEQIKAESEAFRQSVYDSLSLEIDGRPAPFNIVDEVFPDLPDQSVARVTELVLSGEIPENAQTLSFAWGPEFGPIMFRTIGLRSRVVHIQRLEPGVRSQTLSLEDIKARSLPEMLRDFVLIGYEHIVPKGLDHILFVVGLFLLSTSLRPILTQITTFTVAHTVTLGLGAAGVVNLPPSIVEPLIAASIVYVAVENIFTEKLSVWRPFLVFGFGLLHGMGFAGILNQFDLEPGDFLFGLLGFNVGVELGQLTVILACFILVGIWFGKRPWYHRRVVIPGSSVIALVAAYWVLQRTIL